MRAKLWETKEELKQRRHLSIPEQGQWLRQVVMGFFAYHAVPANILALAAFREHVTRLWWRALKRRIQRDKTTWERCVKIANEWLGVNNYINRDSCSYHLYDSVGTVPWRSAAHRR